MAQYFPPTPPDAFLTHSEKMGPHEVFVLSAPSFDVCCQTKGFEHLLKFIAPQTCKVLVERGGESLALEPGQVGLLSLARPFRLVSQAPHQGFGDLVQWRLPLDLVTRRHPGWSAGPLRMVGDGSAGERVLSGLLGAFSRNCASLSRDETRASLTTLVEAMGLLSSAPRPTGDEDRAGRALRFIQEHLYDRELTPEAVAVAQGVTRRHLDTVMKRARKESLSLAIRNARLDEAALTLQTQGDVKLLALSVSLGFDNQSHFARRFKERFGVAPSRFRESGQWLSRVIPRYIS